jgi:hypothetical protein
VSLGIITLSSVWLRRSRGIAYGRPDFLPVVIGASCFIAGGAVYLISSSVVVFGTLAILFAYLAFDILELGQLGVQLFLSILSLACLSLLELFPHSVHEKGTILSVLPLSPTGANDLLLGMLTVAPLVLLRNLYVDASLLKRAPKRL